MSNQIALLEEELERFFRSFTTDGETISVRDILQVVPFTDFALEDPPLLRVLALLEEAGVDTLSLADLNTLFAISDPPSEEDRLPVFLDAEAELLGDLSFREFLDRTN